MPTASLSGSRSSKPAPPVDRRFALLTAVPQCPPVAVTITLTLTATSAQATDALNATHHRDRRAVL